MRGLAVSLWRGGWRTASASVGGVLRSILASLEGGSDEAKRLAQRLALTGSCSQNVWEWKGMVEVRDFYWVSTDYYGRLSDMSGERCAGDGGVWFVLKGASASHQDA